MLPSWQEGFDFAQHIADQRLVKFTAGAIAMRADGDMLHRRGFFALELDAQIAKPQLLGRIERGIENNLAIDNLALCDQCAQERIERFINGGDRMGGDIVIVEKRFQALLERFEDKIATALDRIEPPQRIVRGAFIAPEGKAALSTRYLAASFAIDGGDLFGVEEIGLAVRVVDIVGLTGRETPAMPPMV